MLGDQFQCFRGFLLLFRRLSQFFPLLLRGCLLLSFLHGFIHFGRRILDHGDTVIRISRSFTLSFLHYILSIRIFDQCFGQIRDLLIDGFLTLLKLFQLLSGLRFLRRSILLLDDIGCFRRRFFQFSNLLGRLSRHLWDRRGISTNNISSILHHRFNRLDHGRKLITDFHQLMPGTDHRLAFPASFDNLASRIASFRRPASLIKSADDLILHAGFSQPLTRQFEASLHKIPNTRMLDACLKVLRSPAFQIR